VHLCAGCLSVPSFPRVAKWRAASMALEHFI
jgi:hypothetical protein